MVQSNHLHPKSNPIHFRVSYPPAQACPACHQTHWPYLTYGLRRGSAVSRPRMSHFRSGSAQSERKGERTASTAAAAGTPKRHGARGDGTPGAEQCDRVGVFGVSSRVDEVTSVIEFRFHLPAMWAGDGSTLPSRRETCSFDNRTRTFTSPTSCCML